MRSSKEISHPFDVRLRLYQMLGSKCEGPCFPTDLHAGLGSWYPAPGAGYEDDDVVERWSGISICYEQRQSAKSFAPA